MSHTPAGAMRVVWNVDFSRHPHRARALKRALVAHAKQQATPRPPARDGKEEAQPARG